MLMEKFISELISLISWKSTIFLKLAIIQDLKLVVPLLQLFVFLVVIAIILFLILLLLHGLQTGGQFLLQPNFVGVHPIFANIYI